MKNIKKNIKKNIFSIKISSKRKGFHLNNFIKKKK